MALNYKSSFLMVIALNLIMIVMFFFFSRMNPDLTIFGIDASYFEFCIIGLCLQMVVGTSLGTVCANIYNEISGGTWSSILPFFNFLEYSIGTTLAGVFISSFSIFIAIGFTYIIAEFFIIISFREIVMILFLFILILVSHMSISMLFSAFTIYYQKNSSIVSTLFHLTKTFTGIVFPVSLMTGFPLVIAKSLPLTYGLSTLQSILFSPTIDFNEYMYNCLILVGLSIIIGLVAWILFSCSLKNAKKHGKGDWY